MSAFSKLPRAQSNPRVIGMSCGGVLCIPQCPGWAGAMDGRVSRGWTAKPQAWSWEEGALDCMCWPPKPQRSFMGIDTVSCALWKEAPAPKVS